MSLLLFFLSKFISLSPSFVFMFFQLICVELTVQILQNTAILGTLTTNTSANCVSITCIYKITMVFLMKL